MPYSIELINPRTQEVCGKIPVRAGDHHLVEATLYYVQKAASLAVAAMTPSADTPSHEAPHPLIVANLVHQEVPGYIDDDASQL